MEDLIIDDSEPGVRLLTLNSPSKLNALTPSMVGSLHEAITSATETDCRAIVLTGSGRGFCSGWDLSDTEGEGLTGGSVPHGVAMQRRAAALIRQLR